MVWLPIIPWMLASHEYLVCYLPGQLRKRGHANSLAVMEFETFWPLVLQIR
jgi:hypothetical protein